MYTFTDEQKVELLAWANELETTKFKQTQHTLYDGKGFCCLGIRLNMVDPTKWEHEEEDSDTLSWVYGSVENGEFDDCTLPERENRKLFGYNDQLQAHFMTLNDEYRYTFKKIAKEAKHLVEDGNFTPETSKKLKIIPTRKILKNV